MRLRSSVGRLVGIMGYEFPQSMPIRIHRVAEAKEATIVRQDGYELVVVEGGKEVRLGPDDIVSFETFVALP